jgi:hypothetical protein
MLNGIVVLCSRLEVTSSLFVESADEILSLLKRNIQERETEGEAN